MGRGDEPVIGALEDAGAGGPLGQFIDLVVKWIPGEIVAFYGAAIIVASDGLTDSKPSRSLWFALMLSTVVLVAVAAKAAGRAVDDTVRRAMLGFVSFLIWSAAVPMSGWMSFGWFADHARVLAIGSALAGLVFAKVADLVVPDG